MKIDKVFLMVLILAGFITSCNNSTPAVAPSVVPTVSLTSPDDGETDVFINRRIAATFSVEMDPVTLTDAEFILMQGTTPVSGTVAASGSNVTFTPADNLTADAEYTATMTTGAQSMDGTALASDYVWTFATGVTLDTTAPTVTSSNPDDADVSVALNMIVTATFSEDMDALGVTTATFGVTGPGASPVSGVVDYDLVSNSATFTPVSDLAPSTTFTATITTGVTDLAGNALAGDEVWSFTTGTDAAQTVAQESVELGSSSTFAILASAGITNIPTSSIVGDVGLTPDAGSNISGFSSPLTCPEITGTVYAVDLTGPACSVMDPVLLLDAKSDAEIAYLNATAAVRGTPAAISGDLNGLTLYPGLYESGTSLEISPGGFLYLDAQGDEDAVFIIRSATSITTETTSEVVLTKGAQATNVYWTAGSAITLGVNSIMKGTLIAGTAISLLTGADLEGRALNQGASAAAITLDSCTITVPSL